jgi:hypothetical protein
MRVMKRFVIPWSRDWPEEFWGLKLGRVVEYIRGGRTHADKKKELEAAGFDFIKQERGKGKALGWEVVKAALLAYKGLEGDLLVPKTFVVPSGDPETWPESTRGVKLGKIVDHIRNDGYYKDHKQELLAMGFVYKCR